MFYDRKTTLNEIVQIMRDNGGRVHTQTFINKTQVLFGLTEKKIIEYLKLLEMTKVIDVKWDYMELLDKSNVKPIVKKVVKEEPEEDDPELDSFLDKLAHATRESSSSV